MRSGIRSRFTPIAVGCALALAAWARPAAAHVGSPDTWFEGKAGPYPIRVVVRAPGVVPGLAEINVRVLSGTPRSVTVQPFAWNAGTSGAPPPDVAHPVQGDPRLYARGFTQQSQVLSAVLLVPSTGDGVNWGQVRGMTIASGKMYFSLSDGTLNVVNWNGAAYGQGHPTGSVTTIGGPGVDGTDWSSNAFFVYG